MALAKRTSQPHALGLVEYATALSSHFKGRWKDATVHFERAEQIYRDRCTGVAWELDATHLSMLRAAFYLGDLGRLSNRLPVLIREALERDDLFAATSLRSRVGHVVWLAAGEPDRALEEVRAAIDQWSHRAYHLQHYFFLLAEAEVALYRGEGRIAWRLVLDRWSALRRSLVLMSQLFRIESLYLRARSALATAVSGTPPGEAETLLLEASRAANRIEREEVHWGTPLAKLVRAGIASAKARREEAADLLTSALDAFTASDMALYAAVARMRRGELMGGDTGRALVQQAGDWMRSEGIRNPSGMEAMLAPGRWAG
jgi:hypothetical protein